MLGCGREGNLHCSGDRRHGKQAGVADARSHEHGGPRQQRRLIPTQLPQQGQLRLLQGRLHHRHLAIGFRLLLVD